MVDCLSILTVILGITSSACATDAPRKANRTVVVPIERTAGIQPEIAVLGGGMI
jgi:hypothetical protein